MSNGKRYAEVATIVYDGETQDYILVYDHAPDGTPTSFARCYHDEADFSAWRVLRAIGEAATAIMKDKQDSVAERRKRFTSIPFAPSNIEPADPGTKVT